MPAPSSFLEPLAGLVLDLVATRHGHAALGDQGTSPWLFPGGQPGRPISASRITERLRQLGIHAGPARSTALFQLATELPAAVIARMLGVHIKVAVEWQRISSGDWARYAADYSRQRDRRPLNTAAAPQRHPQNPPLSTLPPGPPIHNYSYRSYNPLPHSIADTEMKRRALERADSATSHSRLRPPSGTTARTSSSASADSRTDPIIPTSDPRESTSSQDPSPSSAQANQVSE